jgi:hypothetical protein
MMARTVDLGWFMARCELSATNVELSLVAPPSDDEPATGISITSVEGIIALRDLLNDAISDFEMATELAKDPLTSDES